MYKILVTSYTNVLHKLRQNIQSGEDRQEWNSGTDASTYILGATI
jgi:hypothetical protein